MMAERFPVDPTNPGEILACAAITRLAEEETGPNDCGFVQSDARWYFEAPLPRATLTRLLETEPREEDGAVWLDDQRLDWFQHPYGLNTGFKFWAGQQSARSVLTNLVEAARTGDPADWLTHEAPTTGRLGVDPQGTWNSLGLGWSVNEHTRLKYLCRPYVELLAFLGLQHFPVQGDRGEGFRYHLWQPAPALIARFAIAGASRYSLQGWRTEIAGAGSNRFLKPAHPLREEP